MAILTKRHVQGQTRLNVTIVLTGATIIGRGPVVDTAHLAPLIEELR